MKTGHWLAIAAGYLCAAAMADVRYTITDLGPGTAADLNNKGEAVLYLNGNHGPYNGPTYLWNGTAFTYLPLPPLMPTYYRALVYAMNDSGQLAGWVDDGRYYPGPLMAAQTAFWANGAGQPPVLLGKTMEIGYPIGLNASGHILLDGPDVQPAIWSASTGVVVLPNLGQGAMANGINDSDVAVGGAVTPSGSLHAVTWHDGQIHQLDSGIWANSNAYAIANDGTTVGVLWSQDPIYATLALWSPSGTLQTYALPGGKGGVTSINNAHQIVGPLMEGSYLFQNGTFSLLKDLVPAGEPVTQLDGVLKINDKGQIIITRKIATTPDPNGPGYWDTALLTPISPISRAVALVCGQQTAGATAAGIVTLADAIRLVRKVDGLL